MRAYDINHDPIIYTCQHVDISKSMYGCPVAPLFTISDRLKICLNEPHYSAGKWCFRLIRTPFFHSSDRHLPRALQLRFAKMWCHPAKSFAGNSNLIDSNRERWPCQRVSRLPYHAFWTIFNTDVNVSFCFNPCTVCKNKTSTDKYFMLKL